MRQDWTPTPGAAVVPAGSVVSLDLAATSADPQRLYPTLVWSPGPREALNQVGATRNRLVVTTLDNVRGRAWVFTPGDGGWTKARLDLPDNAAIDLSPPATRTTRPSCRPRASCRPPACG